MEVALDVAPVNKEGIGLDLRFVYASNETEITDMGGVSPALIGAAWVQQWYVEGYAPGSYWYKRVVSSNPTTIDAGFPLPVGLNPMCEGGDPIEGAPFLGTPNGTVVPCADAPQLYHGRPTPSWSGSFSANLRLGRQIQLLGVVDYLGGHVVNVGDVYGLHHFFFNSKTVLEGKDSVLAGEVGSALLLGDGGQTTGASSLYEAGFMKLRTISATYEFPRSVANWVRASRGSFTLSAENVATLWREQPEKHGVKWIDPEISPNNPAGATGTTTGLYNYIQESFPQLMRIRGTLRFTF
jgi:hypothetical protein